ncbi:MULTISPECIES: helix-turn-helix domain-containing protein [unclassified Nocardia]|uniref:helix-turn-helix domain-containing protein n=2 Tax=Nocardia TaxID=1817 RepID=UPI0036995B91
MIDRTATDRFAAKLRAHRERFGNPTQQVLAGRMMISRAMVADWLSGNRFPSWRHTEALVVACEPALAENAAELREWQSLWEQTRADRDAERYGSGPADVLVREDTSTSLISTTWYRDNPEFYSAAARQVRAATQEIRCTYLRAHPPTSFASSASADYFEAVLDWARSCGNEQRSARRVIAAPTRNGVVVPSMLDWLRSHRDQTAGILSYEANVIDWSAVVDGVSMALLDDTVAFLAFSGGGRQKLNGFSVTDRNFVGYYIVNFEQMWSASTPLAEFLDLNQG